MPGMHFLLSALLVLVAASAPHRAGYGWPIDGPVVVRRFDPPPAPWLAGHRGVDLGAAPGGAVRSSRPARRSAPSHPGTRAARRRPVCTGGCAAAANISIRSPCWGSAGCVCARCDDSAVS